MHEARIVTARLAGRPPADADLADLRPLFRHPRFAATMSADGAPWPEAQIVRFLERVQAHWRLHGFGPWLFHDAGGALVGYGGLRLHLLQGEPVVELMYGVAARFHRQGYATEMARAAIADGERRLVREVCAWTLPRNVGSQKVMQACGFAYERDIVHAGLPHVLYRRRAAPPR